MSFKEFSNAHKTPAKDKPTVEPKPEAPSGQPAKTPAEPTAAPKT